MEVSDIEIEVVPPSCTDARKYLIKLLELVDPDLVKYLQACLEKTTCSGEQSISVDESESQLLTDQFPNAKIDPWFLSPPEPGYSCDEVSYCLLNLARLLRPDLADLLEQINFKVPKSSQPPPISALPPQLSGLPKNGVCAAKPHLKPYLSKLIQTFDPELAECLRERS
nr:expressed protein [Hymenolepis microstoma]